MELSHASPYLIFTVTLRGRQRALFYRRPSGAQITSHPLPGGRLWSEDTVQDGIFPSCFIKQRSSSILRREFLKCWHICFLCLALYRSHEMGWKRYLCLMMRKRRPKGLSDLTKIMQ